MHGVGLPLRQTRCCKVQMTGDSGEGWMATLCYLCSFSVNLKLLQHKKELFKKDEME